MASLSEVAKRIRSKNAGPYWVTIDVFFENENDYQFVSDQLQSAKVANVLKVDQADLSRFDLPQISVIKFSFPRKVVQGSRFDRDMHGAQYANLLNEIEIN